MLNALAHSASLNDAGSSVAVTTYLSGMLPVTGWRQ